MCFLGKVCTGLGTAATNVHRDIYKAAKASLSGDRALRVRSAAASCIVLMASHTSFLYEAPNGELFTVYIYIDYLYRMNIILKAINYFLRIKDKAIHAGS